VASSIVPLLDDITGSAGLDPPSPAPEGRPPLAWDEQAIRALDLILAPAGSRLVAHAIIAVGELSRLDLQVATDKTNLGPSVISLGLLPDVESGTIRYPEGKRRLLMAQIEQTSESLATSGTLERKPLERLVGPLCNLSQLFPEIGAELHGGYRVANVRARSGSHALLRIVSR
jgi:hypothetical protein